MIFKRNLVLVGMMGSGKSTIGRIIARNLHYDFIDIDDEIEKIEGRTISDIFLHKGEKYFRELEVETIISLLESKEKELILSLGGGSFLDEKIRKNVKNNSLSFWLNWKPLTIIKRIRKSSKRPLILGLNDKEIQKMMLDRNKYYAKSDFKIDCDNHKKNQIVDKIILILKKNEFKS